jgi:hypothetical protein
MFAQPTAIYAHGPGLTRRVQLVQEKLPTNIQIVHYFDHGYLEEENSMIHSFTVTFGANI